METPMFANDIKKGARVHLRNGWAAEILDNKKGNTRMAKVFGDYTEIGSIYVKDILMARIVRQDGTTDWETVSLSDTQKKAAQNIAAWGVLIMPCNDGGMFRSDEDRARGLITTARDFEAVLCGILSNIRDRANRREDPIGNLFESVDWEEVGVTRKRVEKWWKDHQKEDEERRAREALEAARKRVRDEALAKLTPAERKALGL